MSIKSKLYQKEIFLGLDLGEKTLGISFSQFGIIAKNLKTIKFERHQYHKLIPPLSKIIAELNINTIVLGDPRHMNNNIGFKSKISIAFSKRIKKYFPFVKIFLWDERLSTKEAIDNMYQAQYKKKQIFKLKDEMAATIILQNFLNNQR
ncbi:Holliday junction resolvase RuvX [Candidatus Phytoplasma bonamiae]|uniref:Putative pre-16S rRNA nuclease n=1 Tax=Candidatus Phytoplasma bonamiae TaxID=2982626 RepID=A0ABT9D550_9MOLU|nr:Holliday junction resolvase RuvX ['Bonamia sp.' little leaf phytoplasma]MDO8064333.1 Holliday junction resolvase RuvX ['Bonamia sp.' little leaf phytoplasma]MDV3174848.1 Holliday junction resolvase RuvX ['Bonamia sp.' little leaf phytoplasma]